MSRPSGAVSSLIRSSMPKTPGTLATMNLASSRWYCQLAVPVRVTKPPVTLASTVDGIRPSRMSRPSTGAQLWSAVYRPAECASATGAVNPMTPQIMVTGTCGAPKNTQNYVTVAYTG